MKRKILSMPWVTRAKKNSAIEDSDPLFQRDPSFEREIDFKPFFDEVVVSIRAALMSISLIGATVFLIFLGVNFMSMGREFQTVFWAKTILRLVVVLGLVATFFQVRRAQQPSMEKMVAYLMRIAVLWTALFLGLVFVSYVLWPENEPFVLPLSWQTFFGLIGFLIFLGMAVLVTEGVVLKVGLSMALAFFVVNLYVGYFSIVATVVYTLFLVTAAFMVGRSNRIKFQARRREFVLRAYLARANDQLKELDRLKTKFFSNLSHELRTPLTMIISPLESILAGRQQVTQDYLESVAANARRLLRQVNMILDFSKIEAGKMNLKLEKLNLGHVAQSLVRAAVPYSQKLGIALTITGHENFPDSEFDGEKIETVIGNILSNALKFTPSGGRVTVHLWHQGDHLGFSIEDTGPGIPPEQLSKLFQRFSQVEGVSSKRQSGTGLGLAMVRELSRLHGGEATVESEVGKGTTFKIEIPKDPESVIKKQGRTDIEIIRSEAPPASSEASGGQAGTSGKSDIAYSDLDANRADLDQELKDVEVHNQKAMESLKKNQPKILFVDDNRGLRTYVHNVLSPFYNVFLGMNGQHGLDLIPQVKPDLILSDVMMPVMQGTEFCRRVRENTEYAHLPFVLLTARGSQELKIEGLNLGADDYLNKPFSEDELLARIKNLLLLRASQARLKQELLSAREIQRSLLPLGRTQFDGVEVDVLYQACEDLSGDFFDFHEMDKGLLFYVADVTSHGAASAQVTYLIKGIFRSAMSDMGEPLDLSRFAKKMAADFASYQLKYAVSVFLGHLDFQSGEISYVSSSFPDPVISKGDDLTHLFAQVNPMFFAASFDPDMDFLVDTVILPKGDCLFVSTDGVVELRDKEGKKSLGDRALVEILKSCRGSNWQEVLLAKLREFASSQEFQDDVTVMRISRS